MDNSRDQAYLTLIRMLLAHPNKVNKILSDHQELIDGGLVHTMRQVVEQLTAQGYESAAKSLEGITNQLATQTGVVTFRWCGDFLLEVFNKVETSNSNQEELYSFLEGKEDQCKYRFSIHIKTLCKRIFKKRRLRKSSRSCRNYFQF